MKTFQKIIRIVFAILWLLVVAQAAISIYWKLQVQGTPAVVFENKTFYVEVAADDQSRQLWLMNREHLDENKWMLFVFPVQWVHKFRMKNTLIPLDMIWIDEIDWKNRVVYIQTAEPCTTQDCEIYWPDWNSKLVLEINAWLAKKYNIWVGDLLYIK